MYTNTADKIYFLLWEKTLKTIFFSEFSSLELAH